MLDRRDLVGEVDDGRQKDRQQGDGEQQGHHAWRQAQWPAERRSQPDPANQHQQRVGKLQRMTTTPEQQLVIGAGVEAAGQRQPGPDESQHRDGRGNHRRVEAEAQRALATDVHAHRRRRQHRAQTQQCDAQTEQGQADQKDAAVEHRDVIGHHRCRRSNKGCQTHQQGSQRGQAEGGPCQRGPACRTAQRPERTAKSQKPDQHRQVNVHHQRDAKKVGHGEQRLQLWRARKHQQDGEQSGGQQGGQAERQPGHGERLA